MSLGGATAAEKEGGNCRYFVSESRRNAGKKRVKCRQNAGKMQAENGHYAALNSVKGTLNVVFVTYFNAKRHKSHNDVTLHPPSHESIYVSCEHALLTHAFICYYNRTPLLTRAHAVFLLRSSHPFNNLDALCNPPPQH